MTDRERAELLKRISRWNSNLEEAIAEWTRRRLADDEPVNLEDGYTRDQLAAHLVLEVGWRAPSSRLHERLRAARGEL